MLQIAALGGSVDDSKVIRLLGTKIALAGVLLENARTNQLPSVAHYYQGQIDCLQEVMHELAMDLKVG
jgi:hypothetical protein